MVSENPIWRIKYFPKNLGGICGRKEIVNDLYNIINKQNFPHLLFVGKEGIGKTTIAKLFAREFLGKYYNTNCEIVYADIPLTDDERSQARSDAYISTSKIGSLAGKKITMPAFIQIKVKPFVQLKTMGAIPFKILIVKNFEALGSNQQGFRRLMEKYGQNCRMILITTKISSIIDPIVSRCRLFLIPQVSLKSFKKLINEICKKESLEIDQETVEILYKISDGKLSRAIDLLQLSSVSGNSIDLDQLYQNSQKFRNDIVRSLLLLALRGDFPKSREQSRKIVSNYKYNSHELFNLLLNELLRLPLSKFARNKLINMIADADMRALDGLDDDIQISSLLSKICLFSEFL